MKVLITGSSGFVGKEVAKEIRKKHTVIEYDLNEGKSILNSSQLEKEMKKADYVIHLAGIIENESPKLWEINVSGTKKVVNAAKKTNIKKLIFMSTTGVYGFTKDTINEKSKVRPENNYEKSKVHGERIVLNAASEKMQVCVVRSAMVFGANEYWKKMFKLLVKKYPLPCSGKNKFQIIYVKELARAISAVLAKGKNKEIYLASGKEKPTLNGFIEMIQTELGLPKGVKHIPEFIGVLVGRLTGMKLLTRENIRHLSKERIYSTNKIQKIGWKQKITLKESIIEVVSEFKKENK
jgi:nucleoside-diphosphate-sugar epimerase